MRGRMTTLRAVLVAALCLSGCASGNYVRSAYGTEGGYSLANAKPKPPSVMVARKIERPLYIVLDAAKLKDSWALETAACATDSMGCERFKLLEVQLLARRDLKNLMEQYFSKVEIVASAAALPQTPHIVADVKVDDIRLNGLVRGRLTYQLIEMTWGFAMRPSEAQDYSFTFGGTASSADSYPTFEAGCATLVENALAAMLKSWVEGHGVEKFQSLPAAPAAPGTTRI
jgi:hypothetical protein